MKLIKKYIKNFIDRKLKNKDIAFNEISLQLELAIYLREKLGKKYRVDLERNIYDFKDKNGNSIFSKKLIKKEVDIIIRPNKNDYSINEMAAIELKYPRNGAYKKRMSQFNDDMKFLGQLKNIGFRKTFAFVLVEQESFYKLKGENNKEPYKKFRTVKMIDNKKVIYVDNDCEIKWKYLDNNQSGKKRKENKCIRMYYFKEIKGVHRNDK